MQPIFGLAQKIWTGTNILGPVIGQGIRVRCSVLAYLGFYLADTAIFYFTSRSVPSATQTEPMLSIG